MVNPRKKPKFLRQSISAYKRLKGKWRKPRGSESKLRKSKKGKGALVSIGYGSPKNLRGLHPSGFEEVLVSNVNDLQKINADKQAIRIRSSVGRRKRDEILKKAEENKIKVLNP